MLKLDLMQVSSLEFYFDVSSEDDQAGIGLDTSSELAKSS